MKKNLAIVLLIVCLCALAAFSLYTVNGKQTEIASLQQSLTITQTNLNTANTQVSSLETEKAALQTTVDTTQASLDAANTQITTLETEKATWKKAAETTQGYLVAANTQITTLETEKAALQMTVDTIQASLDAAITQVTTLEIEKAALQTTVDTTQASLDAANTQITTLKTEKAALQKELDTAIILKPIANTPAAAEPDFIYVNNGTEVQINGYKGKGGVVVIPTEIEGSTVTRIAPNAFKNAKNITGIVLPEKLQYIGENAFNRLSNLTGVVVLPETLTVVDSYAFQSTSITGLVIKGNCTLKINSFENISTLKFIYVAESCAPIIRDAVFNYAKGLTTAVFPDTMTQISTNNFKTSTSMVIYTPAGSFAERYANQKFIQVDVNNYAEQAATFAEAYK